jgi:hypothetical protein
LLSWTRIISIAYCFLPDLGLVAGMHAVRGLPMELFRNTKDISRTRDTVVIPPTKCHYSSISSSVEVPVPSSTYRYHNRLSCIYGFKLVHTIPEWCQRLESTKLHFQQVSWEPWLLRVQGTDTHEYLLIIHHHHHHHIGISQAGVYIVDQGELEFNDCPCMTQGQRLALSYR